ncbi:hypothetical protein LTR08_003141 [Meristemomyces frigidus]|nr:hypothetical protein LTR08_003141 [Meristemomyces frigidus]
MSPSNATEPEPGMARTDLLFTLPPELRDCIYDMVVNASRDVYIKTAIREPFGDQQLISTNALVGTSKELNAEVYANLKRTAFSASTRKIIAVVIDFDFRRLIRFIQSLTPAQTSALNSTASGPTMVVQLNIQNANNLDAARCGAWLKFRTSNTLRTAYEIGLASDPETVADRLLSIEKALPDNGELAQMRKAFGQWWARAQARATRASGTAGLLW